MRGETHSPTSCREGFLPSPSALKTVRMTTTAEKKVQFLAMLCTDFLVTDVALWASIVDCSAGGYGG